LRKSISFKASNEKLVLVIYPESSLNDAFNELKILMDRLNNDHTSHIKNEIIVRTGRRILTDDEKQVVYSIVEDEEKWRVKSIEADVITTEDAIKWNKEVNTRVEFKNIASGEIIDTKGDILIAGDIEAGGFVRATGNIFILGDLRGIVDAGYDGNKEAVIIGSFQNNSEIRINKVRHSIKHEIGNKDFSLPKVYYLTEQNFIDSGEVNRINEIRPAIDQVMNQFN